MREITVLEMECVAGGTNQVIVPHKKIDGSSGLPSGAISTNRSGGLGSVGGGGTTTALPVAKKVCVDEQTQVCNNAAGPKTFAFSMTGINAEISQPHCVTTIKTKCTTTYSSK